MAYRGINPLLHPLKNRSLFVCDANGRDAALDLVPVIQIVLLENISPKSPLKSRQTVWA